VEKAILLNLSSSFTALAYLKPNSSIALASPPSLNADCISSFNFATSFAASFIKPTTFFVLPSSSVVNNNGGLISSICFSRIFICLIWSFCSTIFVNASTFVCNAFFSATILALSSAFFKASCAFSVLTRLSGFSELTLSLILSNSFSTSSAAIPSSFESSITPCFNSSLYAL